MKILPGNKSFWAILAILLALPGLALIGQEEGDSAGGDAAEADAGGGDAGGGDAGGGDAGGGAGGGPGGDAGGAPASPAEAAVTSGGASAPATTGTGSVESNDYVKLARQVGASNWDDVKAFSKDDVKAAAEMASRSGGGTDTLNQLKELKKEFSGSLVSLNKMTRKGENFSLKKLSETKDQIKQKGLENVATFVLDGGASDLTAVEDETISVEIFAGYADSVSSGNTAADAKKIIDVAVQELGDISTVSSENLAAEIAKASAKTSTEVQNLLTIVDGGGDLSSALEKTAEEIAQEAEAKAEQAALNRKNTAQTAYNLAISKIKEATTKADIDKEVSSFETNHGNNGGEGYSVADLNAYGQIAIGFLAASDAEKPQIAFNLAKEEIAKAASNSAVESFVNDFKSEFGDQTELVNQLESVAASKYIDIANPHVATTKASIFSSTDTNSIDGLLSNFEADYPNAGTDATKSVTDAANARKSALSAFDTANTNIASALTSDAVDSLVADFTGSHSNDARTGLDLSVGSIARKSAIDAFETAKVGIAGALTSDAVDSLLSEFNNGADKDHIAGLDLTAVADGRKSAIVAFGSAKTNIAASLTTASVDAIVTAFETGSNIDHIAGLELTSDANARKEWIGLWSLDDIVPSVLYANNDNSGFGAALEQATALADSILTDNEITNSLPIGSVYNASQLTGNGFNYELLRIIAKYGGIGEKSTKINIDSIISYIGGDVSANGESAFSAITNALLSGNTSDLLKNGNTDILGTNKITLDPGSESLLAIKTSNINASLGAKVYVESGAEVDVSSYLSKASNSRDRKVLVIGAAKDLTIKGDATFTNTNDVEDHALAIGAADDVYFRSEYSSANADDYNDPDPITVKYTGSNMGIGSYDTMRLVNVNLETGGNLALASLDELHITSSRPEDPSTFTVGTGGKNSDPDNVYLYAHNLISVNGLQFGGRVDDVYMEAITIDLENVTFPHNSDVMLRSRDGLPTFGASAREVGKVNFINNNKYGSTPIESINQFNGSAGHVNSNILLPNGTPAIKIRGFSTPNSNTN